MWEKNATLAGFAVFSPTFTYAIQIQLEAFPSAGILIPGLVVRLVSPAYRKGKQMKRAKAVVWVVCVRRFHHRKLGLEDEIWDREMDGWNYPCLRIMFYIIILRNVISRNVTYWVSPIHEDANGDNIIYGER